MSLKPVDDFLLEEHAEDLFEHAPCGYISTLEDGTIVKVNATLLSWLGYQRSELLQGKRFQELLNIGGRIFFETHLAPLLKMQGFANEINFELQSKDRKTLPVLISTLQRRRPDGSAIVNRMTVFNITDRKKYERELLLERQKAEKAARAKSDFLSMMSHEIRTPMNAVIGIATLLERTQLTEQQQEYTSMLKTSSENLMNLLNSILDFSKIEAGKVVLEERNFRPQKVVEDSVRGLEGKAHEKGLPLKINLDPAIPHFLIGDPVKISQVITNLVGNAIKFTDNGHIQVSVRSLGNSETMATLQVEVADTGIGIPPDRLPHIFDEFIQADYEIGMKYGGSGLGLAISNKLVEMHGSKILVHSDIGNGSKFTFDLHLKIGFEEKQLAQVQRGLEDSGVLTGLKVLVAEDNEDNVFIIERLLHGWGVTVVVAKNGQEAYEKAMGSSFDLVLMDLRMPIMDGYQATNLVRGSSEKRLQELPIIAFSASTKIGEEDLVEVTAFTDVIGKPFRAEELFSKIAYYTKRSQTSSTQETGSPGAPMWPAGASTGSDYFTLESYFENLDGDKEAVVEILQLVITSYRTARTEIAAAMIEKDLAKFEFQAHRIKSSVEMLQALPLKAALEKARAALRTESTTEEAAADFQAAKEGIEDTLNATIERLKDFTQA